jgi:hypothetical protein
MLAPARSHTYRSSGRTISAASSIATKSSASYSETVSGSGPHSATRRDTKHCSAACKQRAYRKRRKAADKGTTKVINIKSGEPYDVYIRRRVKRGRYNPEESPWHNPFKVSKDASYEEIARGACEKFERYLREERPDLIAQLPDVRGKTLACWCKHTKTAEEFLASGGLGT